MPKREAARTKPEDLNDDAPHRERMAAQHRLRRNPSTDQRKTRRRLVTTSGGDYSVTSRDGSSTEWYSSRSDIPNGIYLAPANRVHNGPYFGPYADVEAAHRDRTSTEMVTEINDGVVGKQLEGWEPASFTVLTGSRRHAMEDSSGITEEPVLEEPAEEVDAIVAARKAILGGRTAARQLTRTSSFEQKVRDAGSRIYGDPWFSKALDANTTPIDYLHDQYADAQVSGYGTSPSDDEMAEAVAMHIGETSNVPMPVDFAQNMADAERSLQRGYGNDADEARNYCGDCGILISFHAGGSEPRPSHPGICSKRAQDCWPVSIADFERLNYNQVYASHRREAYSAESVDDWLFGPDNDPEEPEDEGKDRAKTAANIDPSDPHYPYAESLPYTLVGEPAEDVECTVPGCDWRESLWDKPSGSAIDLWQDHARSVASRTASRRRTAAHACPFCGYDLDSESPTCPNRINHGESGRTPHPTARRRTAQYYDDLGPHFTENSFPQSEKAEIGTWGTRGGKYTLILTRDQYGYNYDVYDRQYSAPRSSGSFDAANDEAAIQEIEDRIHVKRWLDPKLVRKSMAVKDVAFAAALEEKGGQGSMFNTVSSRRTATFGWEIVDELSPDEQADLVRSIGFDHPADLSDADWQRLFSDPGAQSWVDDYLRITSVKGQPERGGDREATGDVNATGEDAGLPPEETWLDNEGQWNEELSHQASWGRRRTAAWTREQVENADAFNSVDGMIVDNATRELLLKVLDKASPELGEKFMQLPIEKAVGAAWKLTASRRTASEYYRPTPGVDIGHWNVFTKDMSDDRSNVPFEELPEEVKDMLRDRAADGPIAVSHRRTAGWVSSQESVNTYSGLSETITVHTLEQDGGEAEVYTHPALLQGKWAWYAKGRDGQEGEGDEGSKETAMSAAEAWLADHSEMAGQVSMFGSRRRTAAGYGDVAFLSALAEFMDRNRRWTPFLDEPMSPIWHEQPGAEVAIEGEAQGLVKSYSATQIQWTDAGIEALVDAGLSSHVGPGTMKGHDVYVQANLSPDETWAETEAEFDEDLQPDGSVPLDEAAGNIYSQGYLNASSPVTTAKHGALSPETDLFI